MKKLFDVAMGFIALAVFTLGVNYALDELEAVDKAAFNRKITKLEQQSDSANLDAVEGQIIFVTIDKEVIVAALGTNIASEYIGTKAIGAIEYNRFTIIFNDGVSITSYIVSGLQDKMSHQFVVYIQ